MIRVADYIIKRIYEEGVHHVFYVPGGQCVYLTDALRRHTGIQSIAMHHEQSVSMAALSYALYNENLGACIVTTGCAGTNTMTGVLHAWQDSIPCIIVSGQQAYDQTVKASGLPLRQVGIQEADTETIMKPITKFAVTVESADKIAFYMDKAIYLAKTGRKGPVWLDVPLNIQNTMVNEEELERYVPEPAPELAVSQEELDFVVDSLNRAERPIILAGQGVRSAGAAVQLRKFAQKNSIPVTFSRFAYDMFPYEDPLNMGIVSGAAGASRYGNFALQNSDLVISIGCRLAIETTGPEREKFARSAKVIVVDIDAVEHSKKGVRIDRFIHGDAKDFLEKMNGMETHAVSQSWLDQCRHWKDIFQYKSEWNDADHLVDLKVFMEKLSLRLPEKSVLVSDAGLTGAAVSAASRIKESDRLIISFAQGEMGYSLPGACGIAPISEGPVISYTGDGSFMMNLQELQTVVRNQFNIKIVIINNNGYSGVRHGQRAHFRGKTIGTDPSNGLDFPDYGKLAAAFGIPYGKAEKTGEIDDAITQLLASDGPYICEVMCDPDQFDLHNALVTYGKRKFGFRPIEDQSPFIDREVFFQEMIVEPMEESHGTPV
ncbi:thiamine pyrophosphate-binding protein [Acutalibacter sp. 1XD8-33]|uniref:thiamine pyrophosphate-binding protein n=1 Tax=Acutalibacter sp. 1XD8-33 TaxID=2320081 RepID=UPI000EA19676|nr:thiamine pyrophosphate-binding protein [Acutalibacter sp. 1XD8-33]RKJ41994.1 thiamine pyrophosphate-binding protein [Acutalibacter sp. 1XD8-33]